MKNLPRRWFVVFQLILTHLYTVMESKIRSWIEKRDQSPAPHVETFEKAMWGHPAGETLLIASPQLIETYLKEIPAGQAVAVETMRRGLAAQYEANFTCPMTSGIFIRLLAEVAYEEWQGGKALSEIAPVWRVIDAKAKVLDKFTFGRDWILEQRKAEAIEN